MICAWAEDEEVKKDEEKERKTNLVVATKIVHLPPARKLVIGKEK